jgi:hypothetical protein
MRALDRGKEGGEAEVSVDLGDIYLRWLLRVPDGLRKRKYNDVVKQEFFLRT